MADITITIPNPVLPRVVDAIATEYGYQANIPDVGNPGQFIPNPETKNQFAKKQVIEFLKRTVKTAEKSNAIVTARNAVETDVDTNVVLS